jgi:thioredoxin-dependent peroxiredoxin
MNGDQARDRGETQAPWCRAIWLSQPGAWLGSIGLMRPDPNGRAAHRLIRVLDNAPFRCSAPAMKSIPCLAAVLLAGSALVAGPSAVKVNPPYDAPATEGTDQEGKMVKFAELYKASPFVVVYFYPKADTPGCTKQGCSLRDAHEDLTKLGVKVVGVSTDTVAEEKAFSDKFKFPFTLIADKDAKVVGAFKVEKNPKGMATRQCFIIKNGKVVWHDPKAATDKQADEVLAVLKELK